MGVARWLRVISAVALWACATGGLAQKKAGDPADNYPNKPIRWIIDFGTGGLSDTIARTVAHVGPPGLLFE